jgi:hypothetical protein
MQASPISRDEYRQLPDLVPSLTITPNPVATEAKLVFDLDQGSMVKAGVYTTNGRLVTGLVNGYLPKGQYQVSWQVPEGLPAGVYICRVKAGTVVYSRRVLVETGF